MIPSFAVQNAVNSILEDAPVDHYWVGGHDRQEEGVFRWIDGTTGIPEGLKFCVDEPNDYDGNEDYLMLYSMEYMHAWGMDGNLNDIAQASPHRTATIANSGFGFIIEYYDEPVPAKVEAFGNHVYARFDTKVWNREAKSRANALNGQLVRVDSAEEAAFLIDFMKGGTGAY